MTRSMARLALVLSLALATALPLAAQEEVAGSTISAIARGEAEPMVYLEGAVLAGIDDRYLFSDGTGVIAIDVDPAAGEGPVTPFELIGVEGTIVDGGVAVSRWARLPILTPAVIVEEPQVIEAFRAWIIAYGSQASTD
jgi:uncharacterized protein YdeI (BOF family)